MQDITVLFVDDEQNILNSLKRIFLYESYKKLFAVSGQKALEILATEPVHVIVSDLQMPKMDGLKLLRKVKQQYPDLVRVVLSGLMEVEQIVPCINTGEIYRYVTKPFDPPEFKRALQDAIEYYWLRRDRQELLKRLKQKNEELETAIAKRKQVEAKLLRLSLIDELTNIPNRRNFDNAFPKEWQRAKRNRLPLSLIMIDIDFFKEYNDTYGHQAGDDCLKRVAEALQKVLKRAGDIVARYGGEEFVVILPNTNIEGAAMVAEEMREKVKSLAIPHAASRIAPYISISLGLATTVPGPENNGLHNSLIALADRMLYAAKNQGRNRLVKLFVPDITDDPSLLPE